MWWYSRPVLPGDRCRLGNQRPRSASASEVGEKLAGSDTNWVSPSIGRMCTSSSTGRIRMGVCSQGGTMPGFFGAGAGLVLSHGGTMPGLRFAVGAAVTVIIGNLSLGLPNDRNNTEAIGRR